MVEQKIEVTICIKEDEIKNIFQNEYYFSYEACKNNKKYKLETKNNSLYLQINITSIQKEIFEEIKHVLFMEKNPSSGHRGYLDCNWNASRIKLRQLIVSNPREFYSLRDMLSDSFNRYFGIIMKEFHISLPIDVETNEAKSKARIRGAVIGLFASSEASKSVPLDVSLEIASSLSQKNSNGLFSVCKKTYEAANEEVKIESNKYLHRIK